MSFVDRETESVGHSVRVHYVLDMYSNAEAHLAKNHIETTDEAALWDLLNTAAAVVSEDVEALFQEADGVIDLGKIQVSHYTPAPTDYEGHCVVGAGVPPDAIARARRSSETASGASSPPARRRGVQGAPGSSGPRPPEPRPRAPPTSVP